MDEKQIQEMMQKLASKQNRKMLIIIAITILLCILLFIAFSHRQDNNALEQTRALQDSLRVHEKVYKQQIVTLQKTHDSAIAVIQDQQDNLEEQMTSIQNHYDKVRKQLTNSSVDSRVKFFSDHLSPRK